MDARQQKVHFSFLYPSFPKGSVSFLLKKKENHFFFSTLLQQKMWSCTSICRQKCSFFLIFILFVFGLIDEEWMVSALWLRNIQDERCTDDELSLVRLTAFFFLFYFFLLLALHSHALPLSLSVIFLSFNVTFGGTNPAVARLLTVSLHLLPLTLFFFVSN